MVSDNGEVWKAGICSPPTPASTATGVTGWAGAGSSTLTKYANTTASMVVTGSSTRGGRAVAEPADPGLEGSSCGGTPLCTEKQSRREQSVVRIQQT